MSSISSTWATSVVYLLVFSSLIITHPKPILIGESGWELNPPRPATRPATGFEDRGAHRDPTTPVKITYLSENGWRTDFVVYHKIPKPSYFAEVWSITDALFF